jgi:hypothetical protein
MTGDVSAKSEEIRMLESRAVVLIVTDKAEPTARLREALRVRGANRDVQFRLIVLNPARAELHPLHPERHDRVAEAEITLRAALPQLEHAARGPVIGSVSIRHDPMDAIEEILLSEPVDEILLDVQQRRVASLLHQDLEHRLARYQVPVTAIRQGG